MNIKRIRFISATLLLFLATPSSATNWNAEGLATAIANSPGRPAGDAERDGGRKPGEVLVFLGVRKGMTVLDLIAAGGWYTEALSVAVGEHGKVYAQNPPSVLQMREGANEKAISARLSDGRLVNVERLDVNLAALELPAGSIDLAITALNFHDVYHRYGEEAAVGMMKRVYQALKPGGVFGVIDHDGVEGNDNAQLHRIPVSIAEATAVKAGFVVEASSEVLRNANDPQNVLVFDQTVRGHTDRFVLRLRKTLGN
jgi:predicted methyltransferase